MPFIIVGALIVGLMLGLMGSGGSILTVPTLVYFLGHEDKVAIAESLAIVGGIALVTLVPYAKGHLVSWRNVLFFGLPGMLGTFVGAELGRYVTGGVQLVIFASVMLVAAVVMFRKNTSDESDQSASSEIPRNADHPEKTPQKNGPSLQLIGLQGGLVGIITGLVGVGGGFLIVPALVMLSRLPMRIAVGTSLAVIVLNSLSGFCKHMFILGGSGTSIDWKTVIAFVVIGIFGSLIGHAISTRLNQDLLRRGFALFLVAMGLFVFANEIPKLFRHEAAQSNQAVASDLQTVSVVTMTLETRASSNLWSSNLWSSNFDGVSR